MCDGCKGCGDCDESVRCDGCDAVVSETTEINGCNYCDECCGPCAGCDNPIALADSHNVDGEHYCDACYDENFCTCSTCGTVIHNDHARTSDSCDSYCDECYSERYFNCEHCGCETRIDYAVSDECGECYCESCYSELYTTCNNCGCEINRDDAVYHNGCNYCPDCSPSDDDREWASRRMQNIPSRTYDRIGSTRKYGVELETNECSGLNDLEERIHFGCKHDGSISGKEFVSPVLRGDDGLDEIIKLCRYAYRNDWNVNAACGYHLHLDVSDECVESLKSIVYAYNKTSEVWASFVPNSRRRNSYCGNVRYSLSEMMDCKDRDDFNYWAGNQERYVWFNVVSYARHRTFEVRLHTGTLDAKKVCNWAKAHTRFADWAAGASFAEIDARFGCTGDEAFAALAELWNDAELTEYYRGRASKFGVDYKEVSAYETCEV